MNNGITTGINSETTVSTTQTSNSEQIIKDLEYIQNETLSDQLESIDDSKSNILNISVYAEKIIKVKKYRLYKRKSD